MTSEAIAEVLGGKRILGRAIGNPVDLMELIHIVSAAVAEASAPRCLGEPAEQDAE